MVFCYVTVSASIQILTVLIAEPADKLAEPDKAVSQEVANALWVRTFAMANVSF